MGMAEAGQLFFYMLNYKVTNKYTVKQMILKQFLSKEEKRLPFILVGLGNPGREYENTRHNIGFMVIDRLAKKWGVSLQKMRYRSLVGEGRFDETKVLLVKPQTYMNNSGITVASFVRFYKPALEQVLVVFDDLDLPFGSLRFRPSGGSSGQKGMQSIIDQIGNDGFPRLRVGVGRPPGRMDASDYILRPFKKNEQETLEILLLAAADAIETFLRDGLDKSMTVYNRSILNDD